MCPIEQMVQSESRSTPRFERCPALHNVTIARVRTRRKKRWEMLFEIRTGKSNGRRPRPKQDITLHKIRGENTIRWKSLKLCIFCPLQPSHGRQKPYSLTDHANAGPAFASSPLLFFCAQHLSRPAPTTNSTTPPSKDGPPNTKRLARTKQPSRPDHSLSCLPPHGVIPPPSRNYSGKPFVLILKYNHTDNVKRKEINRKTIFRFTPPPPTSRPAIFLRCGGGGGSRSSSGGSSKNT